MRNFNRLFGIGPSKSGTHSLNDALHRLGLDSVHLGSDGHYKRDIHKKDDWFSRHMHINHTEGRAILDGVPHQCVSDWPVSQLFKELDEQNQDSLFILTYRNPDDIAQSWCRMCMKMGFAGNSPHYLKKLWQVRRHYDNVFKYFANRSRDLLMLDTVAGSKTNMAKLCEFLHVDLPEDTTWPHSFNHQDWYVP